MGVTLSGRAFGSRNQRCAPTMPQSLTCHTERSRSASITNGHLLKQND